MGNLAQEMTHLREEIDSSREDRKVFIREMKDSVSKTRNHAKKMVKKFRKNRAEQVRAEQETLTSFVSGLKTNVGEIIKGFENDRAGMIQETRAGLLACVSDVKDYVSGLKADVDDMLEAFEDDRIDKGMETRIKLSQLLSGLRSDVDEMLGRFRSERTNVTRETNAALLESLSNTKRFTADIKDYVFALQTGFFKTRFKKAKENKKERERFIADLVREVSHLREGVQALRMGLVEDCHLAGHIWRGLVYSPSPVIRESPAIRPQKAAMPHMEIKGREAAGSQKKPLINIEKQPARRTHKALKEEALSPDDLTEIQGIGSNREMRLNEAGIYTFAQLAGSAPETLRKALGGMGGLVGVDKWIATAKKLARKPR